MIPLKKQPFLLFFFCISFFVVQAQQHPFFGRTGKQVKRATQSKPFFNARVTGTDSMGFGGEPGVVWDRLVGEVFPESTYDYVYNVIRLADGSFAISGSINTESVSNLDGFIIKANADGRVLWKVRLGVRSEDFYPSICATPDGGLVATGPFSIDSSDKTPVIKLSSSGQLEWQTLIHDSVISDWGIDIILGGDGGYIINGTRNINIVDTCNPSLGNKDSLFNVVVKLGSSGQFLWNKNYFIGINYATINNSTSIIRVQDGFVSMNSFGEVKGNCAVDVIPSDLVLLKIDNAGNLKWRKRFGGGKDDYGYSVKQLPNINLLVLGSTNSADGDLIGVNNDTTQRVAWKLIINDTGQIIDNKVYKLSDGGDDLFYRGLIKSDSTLMLLGNTEIADSVNIYGYVSHILKIDKKGAEEWRAIYPDKAIIAIDTINEKEFVFGAIDNTIEIGSFGKLGQISNITGSVYYDLNKNNKKDTNEPYANKFLVTSEKTNYSRSSVATNGWFRNDVDTGNYTTTVRLNNDYYVSVPAVKQTIFTTLFQNDTVHFALQPVAGKRDLGISLIPVTPARPGFNAKYKLTFRNSGTDTIPNGGVILIKDARVTLVSSIPAVGLVTGDSLLWSFGAFKPFDEYTINIELKLAVPPTVNNGDTLRYAAAIVPATGIGTDLTPLDDTARLAQVVVGSYDPNDKQENVAGKIPLAKVAIGEDIQYLIRFQNTGTDTAFTVRITDTLDTKLNWNSLQMIGASHSYKMTVVDGNKISWTFPNISLPDSNVNELLSQGYIAFRIKAKNNLTSGEYFQNKASIYFDYNLPVETNRTTTVVSTAIITSVRNLSNDEMKLVTLPNPSNGNFYVKLSGKLTGKFEYTVVDLYGRIYQTQTLERISNQDTQLIPLYLNRLGAGVYYVVLKQKGKVWQQKIVLQ
ncbi:T9SS type A sorting domain-containing protein [Lacibacter sp. H375]|uniref:DUF7619 domain-containing protein n=1 Tax=Lacibacter sp. H375 TaxID=3133424 RepID=UPI0030C05D31